MSAPSATIVVPVHLACNDYQTGEFSSWVEQIEVGDRWGDAHIAIEGYCRIHRPYRASIAEGGSRQRIRIGRYRYTIREYRRHVGNICWDQITMEAGEVPRLLNDLRVSGGWSVQEAHTWAFDRWKAGEPFVAADFEEGAHDDRC